MACFVMRDPEPNLCAAGNHTWQGGEWERKDLGDLLEAGDNAGAAVAVGGLSLEEVPEGCAVRRQLRRRQTRLRRVKRLHLRTRRRRGIIVQGRWGWMIEWEIGEHPAGAAVLRGGPLGGNIEEVGFHSRRHDEWGLPQKSGR